MGRKGIQFADVQRRGEDERQKLYLDGSHELYCLYFGELAVSFGETELRV